MNHPKRLSHALAWSLVALAITLNAASVLADAAATRVTLKPGTKAPTKRVIVEAPLTPAQQEELYFKRMLLRQTQIWNAARTRQMNSLPENLGGSLNQRQQMLLGLLKPYNQGLDALTYDRFRDSETKGTRTTVTLKPIEKLEEILIRNAIDLSAVLRKEIEENQAMGCDSADAIAQLNYLETKMYTLNQKQVKGSIVKSAATWNVDPIYKRQLATATVTEFKLGMSNEKKPMPIAYKDMMPAGWVPLQIPSSGQLQDEDDRKRCRRYKEQPVSMSPAEESRQTSQNEAILTNLVNRQNSTVR